MKDREYPFSEDDIVDKTGAVDTNRGIMAEVSSLIEVLHLGGSYELVYQLWAQFTLSAVRVNVDVTRSRDEALVSISICAVLFTWSVCIQFVACFSPSFSMGCLLGFCLAASIRQNHMGVAACGSLKKDKRCVSIFARGIETPFAQFAWQHWMVTVAILIKKFQHWVN